LLHLGPNFVKSDQIRDFLQTNRLNSFTIFSVHLGEITLVDFSTRVSFPITAAIATPAVIVSKTNFLSCVDRL
jgi:hypothetical protein